MSKELPASPLPRLIYFSSKSENTLRFVNKLNLPALRLPISSKEPLPLVEADYVLMAPTFGAGRTMGAVPLPVRRFLNESPEARQHCRGVMGSGNTSYGAYATAVDLIAKKLSVPALYKFEVFGLENDVAEVRAILFKLFPELEELRHAPAGAFTQDSFFSS